jgi:hypothetical protein
MPLTNDDITKALASPMEEVLRKEKITPEYLAKKLKRELNAKEVKVFHNKDTGVIYSEKMVSWTIRQKAREDAQKLLGLYPADKHEVTFPHGLTIGDMSEDQKKSAKDVARIYARRKIREMGDEVPMGRKTLQEESDG